MTLGKEHTPLWRKPGLLESANFKCLNIPDALLCLYKLFLSEIDCISVVTNIYSPFMPLTHKYLLSAHVSESKPSVLPPRPRDPSVRHLGRFQPFFPVWLREALGVGMRSAEGSGQRPGLVGPHWWAAGRPEGAGVDEGGVWWD